ncbi:MAG: transcription elongation factor GreA [Spirochaetes bacterium]|nr:MAG: transcription elongation factor GreA [Spirochaetota bacterium]
MDDSIEEKKLKLREELDRLKYEFKVELPKRIAEARTYGDLKENAEYHAARERQGMVKARIAQLSNQFSQLSNLNLSDISKDKIGYGSTIVVQDVESGDRLEFTLVASNDVKPSEGKISATSPVGMALQNHTVGETVEITIPAGKRKFLIERYITIHGGVFEMDPEG